MTHYFPTRPSADPRAILEQPEQPRARIALRRQRGQRADLDKAEAEVRHRVRDAGILVETRRDADGIGKGEPRELASEHRARQRMPRARQRSEEHTSELQSLMRISYAVFCLTKKKHSTTTHTNVYIYNISPNLRNKPPYH